MKKISVLILIMFFAINNIAVSAWACPQDMQETYKTSKMDHGMSDDMPCHEENKKQEDNHCDGLCLCAHVATTPTIMLSENIVLKKIDFSFDTTIIYHKNFISFITAPQGPPPKSFS